jgi:phenylpropionate dioxygenase-like ring-hydroxylating dioxygenase large terminal subunit
MSANRKSGTEFEPQGVRGFDQCWYPLALSSELDQGQVLGRDFLSGRVVLYRTTDGKAHVLSAYCRHLGADLSVGTVVGDELRSR